MSWLRALRRANAAASQKAEDTVNAHIDTSIDLEMSIAEARKHCEHLKASAAKVIADREVEHAKMARMQRELTQAEANTKAALGLEAQHRTNGDEAGATQAHHQAVMIAQNVASLRSQIQTQQTICDMSDKNAVTAQERIDTEMEALQEAMAHQDTIQNTIDAAKVEEDMNASMADLSSASSSLVPTLGQVADRADKRLAEAHATASIQASDPGVMSAEVHHEALQMQAEDVLKEFATDAP